VSDAAAWRLAVDPGWVGAAAAPAMPATTPTAPQAAAVVSALTLVGRRAFMILLTIHFPAEVTAVDGEDHQGRVEAVAKRRVRAV